MKNPFPQYGNIKQIDLDAEFTLSDLFGTLDNEQLKVPVYPHIYNLTIHYEKYKATYQAYNITKEQYRELQIDVFANADLVVETVGWPCSLVWKDFKFRPTGIYEVLYKENENG